MQGGNQGHLSRRVACRNAQACWFACLECALPSTPYPLGLSFHGLLSGLSAYESGRYLRMQGIKSQVL